MKRIFLNWIGVVLIVLGTGVLFAWDTLTTIYLNGQLALTPTSQTYPIWQNSSDPVIMEVRLFNCTNTEDESKPNFKPHVVEVGPFIFKEFNEKVDLEWNDNNTVSYHQRRRWYFDEENSADLDQNVTSLNIVPVSASFKAKYLGAWASWSLSTSLKMLEKSIWTTRPAREFLFEGYSDPLMTLASVFSGGDQLDKMGFFYARNGSKLMDGHYNMETGAEDISTVGLLRNWNFRNTSSGYDEGCDNLDGYLGNFFKPKLTKKDKIGVFTSELCKTLPFEFESEEEIMGVMGYRYVPTKDLLDNGYNYEEAKCNCGGECLPPGVLNLTRCAKGAPMFGSYPHFFGGDSVYLENVTGLDPNYNRSRFAVIVEPTLGIPLQLTAHFQYNIRLEPNSKLSMFANVPTLIFPLINVIKRYSTPAESVQKVKLILYLPIIGTTCAISLILLGLAMVSVSLMPYFLSKFRRSPSIRKVNITTDVIFSKKQEIDFIKAQQNEKSKDALSANEFEKLKAAEDVDNLANSKETDILT